MVQCRFWYGPPLGCTFWRWKRGSSLQKNRQNRKKSEVFTVFGAVSPKLGPVCFFLWGRICHILTRVGLADILSINGHGLEGNWRFERGLRCYFQALFTFLPDSDLLRGRMWMVSGHILSEQERLLLGLLSVLIYRCDRSFSKNDLAKNPAKVCIGRESNPPWALWSCAEQHFALYSACCSRRRAATDPESSPYDASRRDDTPVQLTSL
jgi:hypothetical protein